MLLSYVTAASIYIDIITVVKDGRVVRGSTDIVVVLPFAYKLDTYAGASSIRTGRSKRLGCLVPAD